MQIFPVVDFSYNDLILNLEICFQCLKHKGYFIYAHFLLFISWKFSVTEVYE